MKVAVGTHISSHKKDLQMFVQVIQVFIFSVGHYFTSVLIVHISVDAGREKLRWLH